MPFDFGLRNLQHEASYRSFVDPSRRQRRLIGDNVTAGILPFSSQKWAYKQLLLSSRDYAITNSVREAVWYGHRRHRCTNRISRDKFYLMEHFQRVHCDHGTRASEIPIAAKESEEARGAKKVKGKRPEGCSSKSTHPQVHSLYGTYRCCVLVLIGCKSLSTFSFNFLRPQVYRCMVLRYEDVQMVCLLFY